jgi:hypothetical protein
MTESMIRAIDQAVERSERKHPGWLGDNPYGVILDEVEEAHDEWSGGNEAREHEELLDIIALCVRRLKELGL